MRVFETVLIDRNIGVFISDLISQTQIFDNYEMDANERIDAQ